MKNTGSSSSEFTKPFHTVANEKRDGGDQCSGWLTRKELGSPRQLPVGTTAVCLHKPRAPHLIHQDEIDGKRRRRWHFDPLHAVYSSSDIGKRNAQTMMISVGL